MSFRRFALVPAWLLTKALKPFLPHWHIWKYQNCTLDWWDEGATNFAVTFGALMWIALSQILFVLVMLLGKL